MNGNIAVTATAFLQQSGTLQMNTNLGVSRLRIPTNTVAYQLNGNKTSPKSFGVP